MSPSHLRLLRALANVAGAVTSEIADNADGSHVRLHLERDETLARVVERIQCGPIPDDLAEALAVELELEANRPQIVAEDVPQPDNDRHDNDKRDEIVEATSRAERTMFDFRRDLSGAIPDAINDAVELLDTLRDRVLAVAELADLAIEPMDAKSIAEALGLERQRFTFGFTATEIVAHAKAQRHAGESLRLRLCMGLGLGLDATDDAIVLELGGVEAELRCLEARADDLSAALLESEAQRRALAARLAGLDLDDA